MLTGGHVHDSKVATDLLEKIELDGVNVIADKAYGTNDLRTYIENNGGSYTIPPKSNILQKWDCDYYLYRERHLIENFFNQLKNYRRIATRYDKLAHTFLECVYLASIVILLK